MPDMCMFDMAMPHKNGYETLKEIKIKWPAMKMIIYTMIDNKHTIRYALNKGVNGYLAKGCDATELKKALVSVAETGYYYSEAALKETHDLLHQKNHNAMVINDREIEFLQLCCKGYLYIEIAKRMNVSPRTVEGYQTAIASKLKVKTRAEITSFAISMGFRAD
jgi:two-component system invasion response regulator UvrY